MNDEPQVAEQQLIERLQPPPSPRTRVRAVVALVVGLSGTVFVAASWWTEPDPLAGRTQPAFAVLAVFYLLWTLYGCWLPGRA